MDIVFAVLLRARKLKMQIGRADCRRLVRHFCSEYGQIFVAIQSDDNQYAVVDDDVDLAIDKLLFLSYIDESYQLTDSGLWQFDHSVSPKIVANNSLQPMFDNLRLGVKGSVAGFLERSGMSGKQNPNEEKTQEARRFGKDLW